MDTAPIVGLVYQAGHGHENAMSMRIDLRRPINPPVFETVLTLHRRWQRIGQGCFSRKEGGKMFNHHQTPSTRSAENEPIQELRTNTELFLYRTKRSSTRSVTVRYPLPIQRLVQPPGHLHQFQQQRQKLLTFNSIETVIFCGL